jgi:hypothetical protein
LGLCIAQAKWETSADGIEFMDSTLKTLTAALEAIRDMAANALNKIGQSREEHSMRWKCKSVRICKALHEAGCLKSSKKHVSGKWRFSADVL